MKNYSLTFREQFKKREEELKNEIAQLKKNRDTTNHSEEALKRDVYTYKNQVIALKEANNTQRRESSKMRMLLKKNEVEKMPEKVFVEQPTDDLEIKIENTLYPSMDIEKFTPYKCETSQLDVQKDRQISDLLANFHQISQDLANEKQKTISLQNRIYQL
jgi:hypothetical protein